MQERFVKGLSAGGTGAKYLLMARNYTEDGCAAGNLLVMHVPIYSVSEDLGAKMGTVEVAPDLEPNIAAKVMAIIRMKAPWNLHAH